MMTRQGTINDLDAVNLIDCFDHNRRVALEEGRCLVTEADERIVGFIVYASRGLIGRDFIEYLVVDSGYRRRGVAVTLLRAVEHRLQGGRLFISTEADNTPMLALLGHDGWIPAGRIEGINPIGFDELFFYRDLPRD